MGSAAEEWHTERDASISILRRGRDRWADGQVRGSACRLCLLLCGSGDTLDGSHHSADSSAGDWAAIKVALRQCSIAVTELELIESPHGTRIEGLDRLEDGYAPVTAHGGFRVLCSVLGVNECKLLISIFELAHIADEAPIDGGRTRITGWARMNDERHPCIVDFWWDMLGEKRADDEVGLCELGRLDHELWRQSILDCDCVSLFLEHERGTLQYRRQR